MSDLTNRIRIGNSVDKKLFDELKNLSKETKIPMSRLLDTGIELVVKEYKKDKKAD